jgi:NTE family protein
LVTAATLAYSASFFGLLFSFVLFLTTSWHLSTVQAGVGITPMAAIVLVMSTRVGRVAQRAGFAIPLSSGASLIGAGLLLANLLADGSHFHYSWFVVVAVCGFGLGLCYPLLGAAAVAGMPANELASATAINVCARQLGAALGVAATVAAIGARSTAGDHRFHVAWIVCAGFAGLSALTAAALRDRVVRGDPRAT